jgi:hypothetical protein
MVMMGLVAVMMMVEETMEITVGLVEMMVVMMVVEMMVVMMVVEMMVVLTMVVVTALIER